MKRSKGQDLIEYLLILYTVSIALISLVHVVGISTANLYGNISTTLAQSQVDPENTCNGDTTLGQSCTSGGVSAFYAGTCSHDSLAPSSPTTGGDWQQYYINKAAGYTGTGTDGNNYNASASSEADPACGNSKLYVSQSLPPLSLCQSAGPAICGVSGQNPDGSCTLPAAEAQAWGYGNTAMCNLSNQGAINYCASLGPAWQLPSEDELDAVLNNNSSFGSNALSQNQWYLSSTESSTGNSLVYNGASQQPQNFGGGGNGYWEIRCVKSAN